MIRTILVEDEIASIELIKANLLPFSQELQLCSSCQNISDAMKDIRLYKPDILLLDIELGDGLSFEILEQLPAGLQPRIIFITAYDHYAVKAIKLHAFDYILKPIVREEFERMMKAAIDSIRQSGKHAAHQDLLDYLKDSSTRKIAVPSRNGLHYYPLADIIFIEANGSYAIMHLQKGRQVTVTKKVKDFEISLAGKGFLRVHKSFLVNMEHIAELHRDDNGYLVMSNGARVHLSIKEKEEVIRKIKEVSNIV